MGRILFLAILIGVGLLASSLPSGASATTLDTVSLGTPDLSTPVVPGQAQEDDEDGDGVVTIDDLFAKVAKKYPGFGGMYVDEEKDTIFVYLLDGDLDAVVKELKRVFGEETLPQSNAEALEADYSFLQLKEWHDRLAKEVFQIPEVTLTDIDDSKNRLTVGIEDRKARAQVEELVEELDIPGRAVNIEETEPIQLSQSPQCTDATSLRDRCRPPVGGLQIQFIAGGGVASCTLGFIVEHGRVGNSEDNGNGKDDRNGRHDGNDENVVGFVTNSHCSATQGALDGTVYYQPTIDVNNRIGQETLDPSFTPCFFNPNVTCRLSDSLFAELDEGVGEDGLGYIARPELLNTAAGVTCDTNPQVCAWNGRTTFRIIAEQFPIVGMGATKVGRTTGRTQGVVIQTGVTTGIAGAPGIFLQGQAIATYPSVPGDSGSPAISALAPDPNVNPVETTLLGINWGSAPGLTAFSPIPNVEAELGPLNTCAPPIQC